MGLDSLLNLAAGAGTGGAGPLLSAGLSLAQGGIQSAQAGKLKNDANNAFPEAVDPNQAAFLAELEQKRKSMETGAAFASGMQNAETTGAGTMDAITHAATGDSASTIQGLLQAQKGVNNAKNQTLAQGQQMQAGYDNMYSGMLNKIAARKLQLQMLKYQQNMAEYTAKKSAANQNLTTGAAGLLSSFAGRATPSVSADPLSGKPTVDNTITASGGSPEDSSLRNTLFDSLKTDKLRNLAPGVVPQDNLATQGLGAPINTTNTSFKW